MGPGGARGDEEFRRDLRITPKTAHAAAAVRAPTQDDVTTATEPQQGIETNADAVIGLWERELSSPFRFCMDESIGFAPLVYGGFTKNGHIVGLLSTRMQM